VNPLPSIAETKFAERVDAGQRSSSCSHVKVVCLFFLPVVNSSFCTGMRLMQLGIFAPDPS
jgi:hypothetical protein